MKVSDNHLQYVKPKQRLIVEASYGPGQVKPDKIHQLKLAIIKQVKKITSEKAAR